MNAVRIGLITICLAGAVSGWLSLRGASIHETTPTTRAQTSISRGSADPLMSGAGRRAPTRLVADSAPETAEAAPASLTLDELLATLNADVGAEGELVDRETLAAVLRTDPELTRMLRD